VKNVVFLRQFDKSFLVIRVLLLKSFGLKQHRGERHGVLYSFFLFWELLTGVFCDVLEIR